MNKNIVSSEDKEKTFLLSIENEIEGMVNTKLHKLYQKKIPDEIDTKKIEEECREEYFGHLSEVIESSIETCREFYELLKHDDLPLYQHIEKELISLSEKVGESKSLHDLIEMNKIFISKEDEKKIYEIGFKYFQEELFEKAYVYFVFLTLVNPEHHHVWLARGMAEQNLGKWDEALISYSSSISLLPGNLIVYLQIMDTLILMKRFDEAHNVYDTFIREVDPEIYSHDSFILSKLSVIRTYLLQPVS